MKDFERLPTADTAVPPAPEDRSLYRAPPPPDRSGLRTVVAVAIIGVVAAAVGYLALSGLPWNS